MATNKSARSQATLWGAIGLIGIVVVLALVLIVFPGDKEPDPAPKPTAAAEGCDVPVGNTSSTPKIPDDLDWKAANGWTWPVSPSVGPTEETEDGYGICFARSPLGAALALSNATGLLTSKDPQEARSLAELYLAESPGKTKLMAEPTTTGTASTPARLVGFSVQSFAPERAQLSFVMAVQESPTGYAGVSVTLVWQDDDWKLLPLDNGEMFTGNPTYPAAGEFVAWSASDAG